MSTLQVLLLAFLLSLQVNACLWEDGTTMDGGYGKVGIFPDQILKNTLAESPEDKIRKSKRLRRNKPQDGFSQKETEGVHEVLKGNYDRAIAVFEQTEADYPGRYSTAVNLGTAYELKGELELALKWISEGIRRNPESHFKSEWLHVEILKTRMKLKDDPGYLRHNRVIKLPDSFSADSSLPIGDNSYTVEEIADSIFYQLRERMLFVKPPDPVVADLLFTFAEIEGRTHVVESGLKLFEMANDYGFANSGLITGEIKRYEQIIRHAKIWRISRIVLAVIAVILLLVFAYKKKWFFLSPTAYRKYRLEKRQNPGK